MQTSKVLMLIGSAVASRVGQSLGSIQVDDVLGVMGLRRRRSHLVEGLALLGVGAAVGAGVALLLAPASGSEMRKRLSEGAEKLGEQAMAKLQPGDDASGAMAKRSTRGSGIAS